MKLLASNHIMQLVPRTINDFSLSQLECFNLDLSKMKVVVNEPLKQTNEHANVLNVRPAQPVV